VEQKYSTLWTAPAPSAVVFGGDGTLMDTMTCVQDVLDVMFARRATSCSAADHTWPLGRSIPEISAVLATRFDEPLATVERELTDGLADAVAATGRPTPGALKLVRRLASLMPIAVAGNAPRVVLDKALAQGGLTALIPVTVAAGEAGHTKPAPDIHLAACARLDVDPATALAVESTPAGVRAAMAAGMTVLGVGTRKLGAHAQVTRLDDLALTAWIDRWARL
jgi:beta-phosphoglucomutase-like phosphatase (HAD superfamily)